MSIFNTLTGSEDLPFLGKRGVGLVASLGLCAGMGVSLAQAQEINDQGWSVLEPSVDTRFVFVSSSTGRDTNSGFSPAQAVRSLDYAKSLIRDDSADWMLLKRGDVWNEGIGVWSKSGRSAEERVVITSYGESDERPKLVVTSGKAFSSGYQIEESNVAIIGISMVADRTTEAVPKGIVWLASGDNLLIEDCRIEGFPVNVVCQASGEGDFRNFAIRRSVIVDSWSTQGHSQGMFVSETTGVRIEENVFDHNGWDTGIPGADPTLFNQNVYLQTTATDVEFHGNVTSRASSAGVQMRSGGHASRNLVYANPLGMRFGYMTLDWPAEAASGSLTKNVILGGPLATDSINGSGVGVYIERASNAIFKENVVAQLNGGSVNWAFTIVGNARDVQLDRNAVFEWGIAIRSNTDTEGFVRFSDNLWQSREAFELVKVDDSDRYEFENNKLFGFGSDDNIFRMNGSWLDFTEWVNQDFVDGDELETSLFPDPGRNLDSYAQHLGLADAEAFLAAAREQSRSNWDPALTGTAASEWIRAGYMAQD